VGVLQAISELRRICEPGARDNPFPIMAGTSAGAFNAAALACGADQFDRAVRRVARVWSHFHVPSTCTTSTGQTPSACCAAGQAG